ncbi:MAG: 5-formyltetrahydrofolate cyclo-ligase [Campylobacterota bacterium]|nr:5-formyltetrahydrofolate cyclo-ligase [Campylobacterota bacterium]
MTLTKNSFRKNSLKRLKNSHKYNRLYRTSLINKQLLEQINPNKRMKILLYYPLSMEVDIRKVINILRQKCDVYIPFMVGESFKMVPFRLPLHKKKFGIFEAGNTHLDIKKIDIAIVPTVGVDGNLQRVGFGKGMYDRFFEKLQKRPYTIFTQLEFCYTEEFICDEYDIACDLLVTPRKTIGKKNVKRNTTRWRNGHS